jgi:hypothetical protein
MKALRKGIIFTICLMLVFSFSLYGQKEKKLTLDQMRMEIARQGLTFTVGKTSVSDVPLKKLCGLVEPTDWRQTGKFDGGTKGTRSLPSSWDWRDYGVVTPIQNQGSCGSCWAFGTIGSYESCVAVVVGCGPDDLSEEWLLDCNTLGYGCNGGWWGFPDMEDGVPLESDYPYVGVKGTCNTSCTKYHPMEDWYYVGSYDDVPSVTDIKNAMYEHGPIAAAVYVNSYFQNYTEGIFSSGPHSSTANHAIVLVGWNDIGEYWILKNCWGTGWGECGYMRIKYGANNVGYAAAYGVPEEQPHTVGNTTEFEEISTSENRRAMPFTMPENGDICSVTMYHNGSDCCCNDMVLGVYEDDGGAPGNRLAVTPCTAVSGSAGWQTIKLTSPAYVSGDSTVWLACCYQFNPGIRYQTGSPGGYQSDDTNCSGGMPDPFGSGTQENYIYSIYANYTVD